MIFILSRASHEMKIMRPTFQCYKVVPFQCGWLEGWWWCVLCRHGKEALMHSCRELFARGLVSHRENVSNKFQENNKTINLICRK